MKRTGRSRNQNIEDLFEQWREAKEEYYYYIQSPPRDAQRAILTLEEIFEGLGFYIDPNRGAIYSSYEAYEDEEEPLFELSENDMHGWKET